MMQSVKHFQWRKTKETLMNTCPARSPLVRISHVGRAVIVLTLFALLGACGTTPPQTVDTAPQANPTAAPAASPVAAATAAPALAADATATLPTAAAAASTDAASVVPSPNVDANGRFIEPVSLTILSRVTTTDAALPPDDWFWYKAVKDALNIDVKITFVTEPDQYLPILQTRAAANDLADLSEPDRKTLTQLVDQGLVADWEPFLQYMPQYVTDREVTELAPAGTYDSTQYGLVGHVVFPFKPNITLRKDWLDKLGLDMPKTADEYLEVMKAFTFKDPDGNGKDDTYGFSAAVGSNGALAQMDPIFGAFGACCTGGSVGDWQIADGQLVPVATSPQRLEALQFINRMVEAGVIDPDWKAQKGSDFRAKWRDGKVGIFSDEWCAVYCVNNYPLFAKANPTGVLVIGEPPVGLGGMSGSGARSKANLNQMPVLSTRAAEAGKGEAVARLLEWMNGPGYLLTVFGEEGVGYTKGADGTIVPETNNELLTVRQMSRWAQKGSEDEWLTRYNQDVTQGDGSTYNVFTDVLQRVYSLPFVEVTQFAPLPAMPGDLAADLTRTMAEGEFQFVSGERPFEEWDSYVETVRAAGMDAWREAATTRAKEIGLIQ